MADSKLSVIGILMGLGGAGVSLALPKEAWLGWLLMAVGFGGTLIVWALQVLRGREPSRNQWLEMEQRFVQLSGELSGIWTVDEGSRRIEWSVYPTATSGDNQNAGPRRRSRFVAEARMAGEMVQRVRSMRSTYKVNRGAPAEEHWLCALGAHIDRGSSMLGSGVDNTGPKPIRTQSRAFDRLVEGSVHLCAELASRAR